MAATQIWDKLEAIEIAKDQESLVKKCNLRQKPTEILKSFLPATCEMISPDQNTRILTGFCYQ